MATRAAVPKPEAFQRGKTAFIQGRERRKGSKAFKQAQLVESRRLEKALNRLDHGKHIYAYKHFRTNQVIYSLTRVLDNRKALSQLVFHGKKTVPASLRRDMWAPYFSVHFPHPSQGLAAYRLLREFSLLRELSPPRSLVTTSSDLIERLKKRRTPTEAEEWKHPPIGTLMPKKWRAKNLMDQKATAVADVAAVLLIQEAEDPNTIDARQEDRRKQRIELMSNKGKRRYARRREESTKKDTEIKQRIIDAENPELGIEKYAYARIGLEHGADYTLPHGGVWIPELQSQAGQEGKGESAIRQTTSEEATPGKNQVEVFWADIDDAEYAEKWPQTVIHGELERYQTVFGLDGRPVRSMHVIANGKAYEGEGIEVGRSRRDSELASEVYVGEAPGLPEGIEPKPKSTWQRTKETVLFWRR